MSSAIELPFGSGVFKLSPTKIIALGLNYRDHIKESVSVKVRGFDPVEPDEPVVFPKLPSSMVASGGPIVLPEILGQYAFPDERTDYEGELALVIGKAGKNIAEADALDYVLGITAANDVSQRNIQNGDRSGWYRGKSFDTFLPIGPRLVPLSDVRDVGNLQIETRLNGAVVQHGSTSMMITSIPRMIAFISRNFSLEIGDVILTGTPAGVGPIRHGDRIEVEIEGVGVLSNPVQDPRLA